MVNVRRTTPNGDNTRVSIAFEFDLADVVKARLHTEFLDTWQSKKPSDYLAFMNRLMTPRQQSTPFEDLLRRAREKVGDRIYWDEMGGSISPDPAWCKVLGLPATATKEEIKAKYRQLAKIHHPDAGGSAARFKQIQEAYQEAMK